MLDSPPGQVNLWSFQIYPSSYHPRHIVDLKLCFKLRIQLIGKSWKIHPEILFEISVFRVISQTVLLENSSMRFSWVPRLVYCRGICGKLRLNTMFWTSFPVIQSNSCPKKLPIRVEMCFLPVELFVNWQSWDFFGVSWVTRIWIPYITVNAFYRYFLISF